MDSVEARGLFSPPNGNEPQEIPDRWRDAPGEPVRTDLRDLTDEELNDLGWMGPIQRPHISNPGTSYFTHTYVWDRETRQYNAFEISEDKRRSDVKYQVFWDQLIETNAYGRIKSTASQSLLANTIATEFIALISDAKNNHANVTKIQEVLLEIMENIPFTEDELGEIADVFSVSNMLGVYTLE